MVEDDRGWGTRRRSSSGEGPRAADAARAAADAADADADAAQGRLPAGLSVWRMVSLERSGLWVGRFPMGLSLPSSSDLPL